MPRVLLIGWDAADWKVIRPLMDAGKMPNVRRLVENGASGPISTLHPPLSPILWTSIATGKRAFKHGIHGFSEPTPDGRGVRSVSNLSRKSKALWNILSQNELRSIVIGWWPSHPVEPIEGVMVSDHYLRAGAPLDEGWPMLLNTVHPQRLANTLASLRIHPDQLSPAMIEPFIPLAREIDQDKDNRLGMFMHMLAECMTIQSAAAWLLDNERWDFFAVYFESLDHFSHAFMRYYPPRQSWIGERDFQLYSGVVSMAYRFHDEMLGTLLEKAGHETTVILMSDHGFHPDHLRPASIPNIPAGPVVEHRDFGIFAISGPDIKKGGLLHGTSLLDVAPTVLALYGLPVGEDMDGKVLSQAFAVTPRIELIPTWEDVTGEDGRHPPHTRLDPAAAHQALEQMIALGYIERPDENREVAVAKTIRELRYNLGESYQDAGRHVEAREIFTELCRADTGEDRFAVRLFVSCQALGMIDEMRQIADRLEHREAPVASYLRAQVLVGEKRYEEAAALLEQEPAALLQTADLYLRLRRMGEAGRVYKRALELDPDNGHAYIGLSKIALRNRQFSLAAQAALDALQRIHHDPQAHFLLGRALTGMKEYKGAAEAFRAAISFNPNFPQAHTRLAELLETQLGDRESAEEHRRLASSMRRGMLSLWVEGPAPEKTNPRCEGLSGLGEMPALAECLTVVTGLPRSGTSMVMQMLAAGGMKIVSDRSRQADEDNPRGYFEFAAVKNLGKDSTWLSEAKGKAIKIVAPLLLALPPGLACRVILCERAVDEVLDSQQSMLQRRSQPLPATPERRRMLRDEYVRILGRVEAFAARRPSTQLLAIGYETALSDPMAVSGRINDFLGSGLDVEKMAAAVDAALRHYSREARSPGAR